MQIKNEALFKNALQSGINLFLGAGFSLLAEGARGNLPVGDSLKLELLKEFLNRDKSSLTLSQICQMIANGKKRELQDYLIDRFTVLDFDKKYNAIERIAMKSIFTTNIDNLIFQIYAQSDEFYVNDILLRGPATPSKSAIDYIALHGCVIHPNRKFDFSPIEIASSFERDKDKWFGYMSRIQMWPTLYWGYRLEDAGVLQSLATEATNGRSKADSWITVRKQDDEAIEYFESLGFHVIVCDTDELLTYIANVPQKKRPGFAKSKILSKFPEYAVPDLSAVVVRSVSEFYLGAEPTWYDVYAGGIHKTQHFAAAKNAVYEDKHVLLLGSPVTGKSTLLKQLATAVTQDGPVLYIDEVTPEKATLLAREADHQSADILIFIDNAADATDAINILSRCRKVKIIAAERDYYFDIVSHKFNKSEFTILDVSGLADSDIQEIQNLIPRDVSRRDFRRDLGDLDSQEQPTIFEFFIKTIIDNSLIERFLAALKELKSTDLLKHDLLIAACYLYNCRVPMSLDVAAAFSSSYSVNAIEAKNILDGVGSLLSPYEGTLAELRENYYVPRSRSIAETVLQKVAGNDLRRVFDNFHNYVSPTKITRYDIFKRSAYDARLMKRAYPNFRDGIEFYESAFTRDPSHYLKQQGALYLSDRGQTELAFSWIDQARSMAGKNNPTIRNSYAVILFDANYSKPVDADVVATLNESMQILDDCYNYDKRKAYHAKVFAEQALRFYEKVPNEPNIKSYLVKAQKWIDAERTQRKSARWMNPLNRKLSAALRSL